MINENLKFISNENKKTIINKSIIVYYSRTKNTKFVAEEIMKNLGSDIIPLKEKKNRSGAWGYMMAGFESIRQKKSELEDFATDFSGYDVMFLGCPNWAYNLPPALRTFLGEVDLENKKVVLFCTQDGSGAEKVFNSLRVLCKGADVIDEKFFNKVLKNKENVSREIEDWLKQYILEK